MISLIREHTEAIQPPRALWVPFELGRPFGTPDEPAFQLDVLHSVLGLIEEPSGPVLRDFPNEAPHSDPAEGWACPLPAPPPREPATEAEERRERLLAEIRLLRPWFEEAVRETGRTAFGVSGLTPAAVEQAALTLVALVEGENPAPPEDSLQEMPILIRFLADDLKAFYFEAAAARPAVRRPSSGELNRWLFRETVLGTLLYDLRDKLLKDEDPGVRLAGRFLVPAVWVRRE